MKFIAPVILNYFPEWNERVHTIVDAQNYCLRRGIALMETDLIDELGEYRVRRGQRFIFLNKFAESVAWVIFHEIGHDLFHSPASCRFSARTRSKIEAEANVVAAVALIPQELLRTRTLWEIRDEYDYPPALIQLRWQIWDNFRA